MNGLTLEQRKRKNADAQAAFRLRRNAYIGTLESTVEHFETHIKQLKHTLLTAQSELVALRQANTELVARNEVLGQQLRTQRVLERGGYEGFGVGYAGGGEWQQQQQVQQQVQGTGMVPRGPHQIAASTFLSAPPGLRITTLANGSSTSSTSHLPTSSHSHSHPAAHPFIPSHSHSHETDITGLPPPARWDAFPEVHPYTVAVGHQSPGSGVGSSETLLGTPPPPQQGYYTSTPAQEGGYGFGASFPPSSSSRPAAAYTAEGEDTKYFPPPSPLHPRPHPHTQTQPLVALSALSALDLPAFTGAGGAGGMSDTIAVLRQQAFGRMRRRAGGGAGGGGRGRRKRRARGSEEEEEAEGMEEEEEE